MQFIGTGDRILTENFNVGYLYTITFKTGIYINSACIGVGDNFVMFQRAEPDLLFTLNVDTADEIDTIELYDSGGGTNDYDDLVNRPQINSHTLTGNMSGSDLGLQDTIPDLDTIRAGAAAGATAVQPSDLTTALATKQDTLSAAQLNAVNSGVTSTDVSQIQTNKNNISKIHNPANVYFSETAPTGTILMQSYWISSTGVHVYGDNVYGATLEQGSFETFSGAEITANNRVRTTFDSQAPMGTYTVSADGADDVVIYAYTSNSTSSWSSADSVTAWQPLPYTFTTAQNLYLRFAFRHRDNTAIAPTDVTNIKVLAHTWTT